MMDSIAGPIQVLSRQFPNAQQGKGAALNHAFQIVLADAEKDYSRNQILVGVVDADGFSENIINELTAVSQIRQLRANKNQNERCYKFYVYCTRC